MVVEVEPSTQVAIYFLVIVDFFFCVFSFCGFIKRFFYMSHAIYLLLLNSPLCIEIRIIVFGKIRLLVVLPQWYV